MQDPLESLRAIFRDELDDQVAAIDAEIPRLDGPERAAALATVHRCLHTLKGAARTVGYDEFAASCHDLETATVPGTPPHLVADRLRAFRDAAGAFAASIRPPPSKSPSARRGVPSETPTGSSPAAETIRLQVDQVADLVGQAEALVALASAGAEDLAELRAAVGQLTGALKRLGAEARRAPVGPELVDVALGSSRALDGILQAAEARTRARSWRLARGAVDVFEQARRLQIVRLDTLAPALERAVAEAARLRGRRVALELALGNVSADRALCEAVREPLAHLVRNAVDHGIESPQERIAAGKHPEGRVRVSAEARNRAIRLVVADDGRGVDLDDLRRRAAARGLTLAPGDEARILFEPGFSTRPSPDALSGRGVGLDVVNAAVTRLDGWIRAEPEPGAGLRFVLHLPIDVGVVQALVVSIRGVELALPLSDVEQVRRVPTSALSTVDGAPYLREPDGLIPIADLGPALGGRPRRERDASLVIRVRSGEQRVAVPVDGVGGVQELVVRALGRRLAGCAMVGAAAMVGDRAIPVLDPSAIAGDPALRARSGSARVPHLLVVDDSATTRAMLRAVLESAGYRVTNATDGLEALGVLARGDVAGVVSDLEMPRMDGLQLLARIRADAGTRGLPVVLVTGRASGADRRRALELGASAYVVKGSYEQDRLLTILEELLT